jgi:hypothetical protein
LRARIVDNVKRLQKQTGEDWNECWRRLYKRFLQNHNNINLFNVGSKLEYLVNHGYGEELLRTALEI